MAFRLPPLSSLRVFEAAARHNSFRKAAEELNLTASAVSHGIQTLENWLGVELFYRETRGLRLTGAGEIYAPLVNQALSVLAKATDHLPGRKATGTLSVSSAPTFGNKILLPRLGKFIEQFPDIRVTIDTSQGLVDLTLDDFDIAIRYASTKKPAANWTLLVVETLIPVCSPDLEHKDPHAAARLAKHIIVGYFREGLDTDDPNAIAHLASLLGLDPGMMLAGMVDPEIKAIARWHGEEAVARGVFGSPWIFVDGEPF